MTPEEARQKIKEEFIARYYQWLQDEREMTDKDYGWKYGWLKSPEGPHKDILKTVETFHRYIFSGRWLHKWVEAGYPKEIIWQLNRDGFLSYKQYSNYMARAQGKTDWYFVSQKVAKDIWRELKH